MKNYKSVLKKILLGLAAIFGISAIAKAESPVQNAFRGNAKYNVVATVLGIIFAGIIVYLVSLDKRMSKLEKDKDKNA